MVPTSIPAEEFPFGERMPALYRQGALPPLPLLDSSVDSQHWLLGQLFAAVSFEISSNTSVSLDDVAALHQANKSCLCKSGIAQLTVCVELGRESQRRF